MTTKTQYMPLEGTGRPNVYIFEVSYEIQESSGAFDGYKGGFSSAGLIDLNIGKVVVRYNDEICK